MNNNFNINQQLKKMETQIVITIFSALIAFSPFLSVLLRDKIL